MAFNNYLTINAHRDFELNRSLDYTICIPKTNVERLVIFVNGFGNDVGPYSESFQKHICKQYAMACLVVEYHCIHSRAVPGTSEVNIDINPHVEKLLRTSTGCLNNESIDTVILKANELKADKNIPPGYFWYYIIPVKMNIKILGYYQHWILFSRS